MATAKVSAYGELIPGEIVHWAYEDYRTECGRHLQNTKANPNGRRCKQCVMRLSMRRDG